MYCSFLMFLFWTLPWYPATSLDMGDIFVSDTEPRSRLTMVDGHMWFQAGMGKNITFGTSGGGTIFVGNTDVSRLPEIAVFNSHLDDYNKLLKRTEMLGNRMDTSTMTIRMIINISRNIVATVRNISTDVTSLKEWRKDRNIKDVRMRRFLGKISKAIKSLIDTLASDGCTAKPCQAGGTCIPRFGNKTVCICPPHRTGAKCEFDLDECDLYEGAMACQNNATCTNIENGFLCNCARGFHGPLCQFEHVSCRKTAGLCGRGHCIENDDVDGKSDYKCICESGYRQSDDPSNPTCIDVNECDQKPCHPGVDCINLPGTFQCSGCPKGYQGNGRMCVDIDECSSGVFPCSASPRVQCYNTIGSYHCGACPTGFYCHCPSGYLGDGIGPDGCTTGNSTICRAEGRCMNGGSCKPVSENSYRCVCSEGYFGAKCEKVSECISMPCRNGGECQYDVTNGYSCICPGGFYGHDCELEEDACGQHFEIASGNLTFPDDFASSPSSSLCDIVIQPTGNNEALRLTFSSFSGMSSDASTGATDCRTAAGNLSLYDGDNDNSPLFATFCGERSGPKAPLINEPITMTGSRALLRFRGTKGKFVINWELVKRDCGYRTTAPSGSLVVPVHHMNASCEWFVSAPADKHVEIEIPAIEMYSGMMVNCSLNRIQVFDGYTAFDAHRIVDVCNTINDTITIRTTGPFMSISFFSSFLFGASSPLQKGFNMKYTVVEPDRECGGEVVNTAGDWDFGGEITSPNYPGFYPAGMDCTWKIDGVGSNETSDQTLKIQFLNFDVPSPFTIPFLQMEDMARLNQMEYGGLRGFRNRYSDIFRRRFGSIRSLIKCTQDYVHVFSDGVLIKDGCNANNPSGSPILLESPRAIIQFHSNNFDQGKGFRMQYEMVCEKHLTGNGTVQTWNYPEGGRKGKCTYVIEAGASQAIRIKFKTIGLRTASSSQCFFTKDIPDDMEDYVKFTGGRPEDKVLNQKYICSKYPFNEGSEFITSATRPLTVEFSSGGGTLNTGLLFEYSTIDVGCGGIFTSSVGTIRSPNYPDKYLPHMHCIYQIAVPWSKQVRLTFDNFDVEVVQNDDCNYDRVEVWDRYLSDTEHGQLLGRFCGSTLPPSLLSSRFQLTVVFISDRSVAGNGFSARFESVDVSTDCDRSFTAPTGMIVFDGKQGRFAQCEFHIALPHNSRILLTFNNMSMPCRSGKLQIRNGLSAQSPGFPALWGDSETCDEHPVSTTIRSHGNRMFLLLQATDSDQISFNISYEQIVSTCGGLVSGVSGSLAAPQYPQKDSRPLECQWTVAASLGNRVRFTLAMIDDLRSSDDNGFCGIFASNRLDVLDGPHSDSTILRRFCKKVVGATPIDSEDHEIAVRYKQHGGVQYGALFGFLAHFTTICTNIVHTDFTGSIQSPGYPDPVNSNQFCSWTIQVPRGNRIELKFHTFVVEQRNRWAYKSSCFENWIKFGDGEVGEATVNRGGSVNVTNQLVETCSSLDRPVRVKSSNNTLHISYQSKNMEQNQFWLTWRTVGCGGDIIQPENITVGTRDLDDSHGVYECNWKIKAPVGKKIELKIASLTIFRRAKDTPCNFADSRFSGFETYAGTSNISGVPQETICDGFQNFTITSHTNHMFIRMKVNKNDVMSGADGVFFSAQIVFVETNPSDDDDCGGIVDVPLNGKAMIHSPRFPKEYPRGTACEWIFKAPTGHRLQFLLKEYNTPNAHAQKGTPRWQPFGYQNVTCKHPLPLIEGALTIFNGNKSSEMAERWCLDTTEPHTVDVDVGEALVTFQGAVQERRHMSGDDEENKKIGFILEASPQCGGLLLAEDDEQTVELFDLGIGICNITIKKKNQDEAGIVLRIDEIAMKHQLSSARSPGRIVSNSNRIEITLDGDEMITRSVMMPYQMSAFTASHEEFRAENEIRLGIVKEVGLLAEKIMFSYSTEVDYCGADIKGRAGTITSPNIQEDYDCVWTLRNNPGNIVLLNVFPGFNLPSTENCTTSYLEIRRFNESGPVLARLCGQKGFFTAKEESLWIQLRKRDLPADEEETFQPMTAPVSVRFNYRFFPGGLTESRVIAEPMMGDLRATPFEHRITVEPNHGILVHFESLRFPAPQHEEGISVQNGLYFLESGGRGWADVFDAIRNPSDKSLRRVSGFEPPANDIYLPFQSLVVYVFGFEHGFKYRFTWTSVPLRNANESAVEEEDATKTYDCGHYLHPTWEWQEITNPVPIGQLSGYAPNLHCKWTMERPLMTGIQIRITKLDLEDVPSCSFDFVAIVADKTVLEGGAAGDDIEGAMKMCHKSMVNATLNYSYNRMTYIHFKSDRSRAGTGFIIQYKLSCNSFEYIKSSYGLFNYELSNPGYPLATKNMICNWNLVLESNRRISVKLLDLDIEDSPNCETDQLFVDKRFLHRLNKSGAMSYCGKFDDVEQKNFTIGQGRVFISYTDDGKPSKGFKLLLSEVMEECSSEHLVVDESRPVGTFVTPSYPDLLPNTLDCEYVIRSPSGTRVKFTVDPTQFRLEAMDDVTCLCDSCDYLELRDGPTEHSPLIGRYCNTYAPSTIFSTGNYLFIKLRTDSYAKSSGFTAKYELASCGGTIVLRPNDTSLLHSPGYPDTYGQREDCTWTIHSPNSHMIEMSVNSLWLIWNANCSIDSLAVRDGNSTDRYLMEPRCLIRDVTAEQRNYRTSSSLATVEFKANTTTPRGGRQFCKNKSCGFELAFKVSKEGCGGLIRDNQGSLTTPGYPNRLLPNVQCTWELQAGLGYRYLLEFEFLDERNGYYLPRYMPGQQRQNDCFPDLFFLNGKKTHERANFMNPRMFCSNETTFISQADIVTVHYSDAQSRATRLVSEHLDDDINYLPFRINYTRVPANIDKDGCTFEVTGNMTKFIGAQNSTESSENESRYCHLLLKRPAGFGTTVVTISNYTDDPSNAFHVCSDWASFIDIHSVDGEPREIDERICSQSFMGKTEAVRIYLNREIDIHSFSIQTSYGIVAGQQYNLNVNYYPCGGVITAPNEGVITSPNFGEGRTYPPNSHCQWMLVAPEGQVVQIQITDMDIEFDVACKKDAVVFGEGRDNSIIHRHCIQENMDINGTMTGPGAGVVNLASRHASMKSHSRYIVITFNSDGSDQYRGFRLQYEFADVDGCGFTTHAMTGVAHSPNFPKDYGNDQECIWDIQVPVGFHVVLHFTHFNIEAAEDCANDALVLSEEHNARADDPMGQYFFILQDEELHPPVCGLALPPDYRSSANRIRLNFTSNEQITAQGFRVEWAAACGTVYRASHYSIVSPYYPEGYPNNDSVCEYFIDPQGEFENAVIVIKVMDLDLGDDQDTLEITDVENNRLIESYSRGDNKSDEALAIKGSVGIRFTTKASFGDKARKHNRGFQISYEMRRCGGNIELNDDHGLVATLSSPGFPLEYPHNLDCLWNISTIGDRVFSIKFDSMDIEQSDECEMDAVELYDGFENSNKTAMGKYCGDSKMMPQSRIYTKHSNMLVRFVSDRSMKKGGFKMIITATLGAEHGCGGSLKATGDWQSIAPPMYTDDTYQASLHCGWNVVSAEKTILEFKLNSLDTEKLQVLPGDRPDKICVDGITIYDGYKSFSPILAGDICSETVPTLPVFYHSSHKIAHVYFESDASGSGKGFDLQYRAISPDCGDWLVAKSEKQIYSYQSKQITEAYTGQTHQKCQWVVQSKTQTPMWIHLRSINFPSRDGDCSDSFVEIRDVGIVSKCQHPACARTDADKKVVRLCGSNPMQPFISNTMAVQITTSADINNMTSSGFTLEYQLLDSCNRSIDATYFPSGYLASPNFPNPYDVNSTCLTTIEAPPNQHILIVFRSMRLENGRPIFIRDPMSSNMTSRLALSYYRKYYMHNCDTDYVQIFDSDRNATKKMCGSGLPTSYLTETNVAKILFQSDESVVTEGFEISYFTSPAISNMPVYSFAPTYAPIGAVTNIGYPGRYNVSQAQKWTLRPPAGHDCKLELTHLSLSLEAERQECTETNEWLLIEIKTTRIDDNGKGMSERIRSCSHSAPMSLDMESGEGRSLIITFQSDDSTANDGNGFRMEWDCGNHIVPQM